MENLAQGFHYKWTFQTRSNIFVVSIAINHRTPFIMPKMGNDSKDHKMIDRQQKIEDILCWVSLPVKLRLMILEILAHDHGLASYASVCKE